VRQGAAKDGKGGSPPAPAVSNFGHQRDRLANRPPAPGTPMPHLSHGPFGRVYLPQVWIVKRRAFPKGGVVDQHG
jgi:hypothetical protein